MARKRKCGEGTLRLRKDGRWEGRVVIGYDEKGNPKTKNVLAKTKQECKDKLEELKVACKEERPNQVNMGMSFGDWLGYWFETFSKPTLRPTTQSSYAHWIKDHLTPGLGHIPLGKLSQSDLQQFFNRMKKSGRVIHVEQFGEGMSDRSVRSCYAVCRMALDRAVKDGLIYDNPALGCKLPPMKTKEMKTLTQEEIQRFLIQAKEEGLYELFLLELTTGMRRGELLALQWDDLDFCTGELRITKQICPVNGKLVLSEPKTNAGKRTNILPQPILDVLAEYKKEVFSPWIFPSRFKPEQPITPDYVGKRLQDILDHAGCKRIRFHDLRHTFATMALENGMDVKTLSTIIGHVSSRTTLDIYAHTTDEMRQKAAQAIDQGIAGAEMRVQPEQSRQETPKPHFTPYKPPHRRPGTGCVSQLNDHLWEGRYSPVWPDGKKHSRNVYTKTEAECEEKLKILIREMKQEIAQERARLSAQK